MGGPPGVDVGGGSMWQLSLGCCPRGSAPDAQSEAQKPSMRAHCHRPAAPAAAARATSALAIVSLALLTACLADAVDAPGADRTPVARLSLDARVASLGTTGGVADDRTVDVRAFYRRLASDREGQDERTLPSSPATFTVAPGTTTEHEIIVQVAQCLGDPQRVGAAEGGCRIGIELRLLDAGGSTLATETTEPAEPVSPGGRLDLGTVTLADVSAIEVGAVGDSRLRVGRTLQLSATAKNAQGVAVERTFRWTSSDASIAQVDQATGLVTAIKPGGPVAITASSGGKRAQVTLTVVPRVATVDVNPAQAAVKVNGAVQLTATPKDAGGAALTDRPMRWDADNSGVFAISPNGLLTGVRPGSGELTVTVDDSAQRKVQVTVTAGGITLAPNPASVAIGGTAQLTATVTDANGAPITNQNIPITWTSGNTGIATVDASSGLVTGRAVGQASITAAGGGVSAQVPVNVVSQVLNLQPSNPTILAARTVQLTAENVLGTVTWASSDNNVAVVSAGGLVTGLRPGTATISATSGVQSGRTSVTVTAGRVDVTPNPATVPKGESLQLTGVVRNADGAPIPNVPISWDSNNLGAATVNSTTGQITGVAEGQATITASGGGARGTGLVTVTPALVGSIDLSPLPQGPIYPGTAFQLTATVKDARGNPLENRVVSFQSSNAAVLTVTTSATTGTNGLAAATVTIVAPGTASLSVAVEDKRVSGDITVTPLPPSRIEKASADNVECVVGSVACQFAVKVTNSAGQTVSGAQVKWTSTGGCTETLTLSTDATGISRTGNVCAIATAGSYAQTAELGANGDKVTFPFKVTALPTLSITAGSASTGTGTVTSQVGLTPAINCTMNKTAQSGDCSRSYQPNTQITLTAVGTSNSTFAGWGGACSGTSPTCTIALTAAQSVTASFTAPQQLLTVALSGTGTGSVVSNVGAIDCRRASGSTTGTCTAQLAFGTTVVLRASTTDTVQVSANGGCTLGGTASSPQLTCVMDQARTVGLTFTAPPKPLTVTAATTSSGTGQITSQAGLAPAINCLITGTSQSNACTQLYPINTAVTLTATPTNGARFTGWGGDCAASGTTTTCGVSMSAARSVIASFAPTLKAAFKSSAQNADIVTESVLIDVTSDGGTASDLAATVSYAQGQRSGYVQVVGFDRTVTPAVLTLTVDRSALPAGTYNWTVTVTSKTPGVAPAIQNIVTTVSLALYYRFKDQTPRAPTGTLRFDIGSLGGTASGLRDSVAYDAGQPSGYWTSVTLNPTVTPAVLSLQWSTSGIPVGTYNSTITVSSTTAGFSPLPVRITFIVTAAASQIVATQVHSVGGAANPSAVPSTRAMPGAVSRPAPTPR